jgi:hypothetical protein
LANDGRKLKEFIAMISSTGSSRDNPNQRQDQPPVISRRVFRQMTAPKRLDIPQPVMPGGISGQPALNRRAAENEEVSKPRRRLQFMPAFWTISGLISLAVNVILIVVLLSLANQVFTLKAIVKDQLIDGLANNFALMDQARIKTNINVSTNVPAKFILPLDTDTSVTLTKDTQIKGARVSLSTGGLQITSAPTNILLPAGTVLPIHLTLEVPVDQQIPVKLDVPVDIPLNQTDLHQPFVGLQNVVKPYQTLLESVPGSWTEIICGTQPSELCQLVVP